MIWFPIECAPKDGTEFLAWDEQSGKFDVCYYHDRFGVIQVQQDSEYGPMEGEFGYMGGGITAWQPLPAAPGMSCPVVRAA